MKTVTIVLPLERETKGALLYRDSKSDESENSFVADSIYLRKAGVGQPYPKAIKLTIEES